MAKVQKVAAEEHAKLVAAFDAIHRSNCDLQEENYQLRTELQHINDLLIEVRRIWRPAGIRGQQLTAWDALETYMRGLPKQPSYELQNREGG